MNKPTENPFQSLHEAIVFSSKDFSVERTDAWIYAIVIGWDDAAYAELAGQHKWTPEIIARLKRLREAFEAAAPAQT